MTFFKKQVDQYCSDFLLRAFQKMPYGRLQARLPDGRVLILGGKEPGPEARVTVHHLETFTKCFFYGDIGFGESYTNGDWDTDDLTGVIAWFITNLEYCPSISGTKQRTLVNIFGLVNQWIHAWHKNTPSGSRKNIEAHYDLSNDFFKLFLDPTLTYSSAYFLNAEESLEQAQIRKYDVLCQKLRLKPDDEVLEIGCGWGGFSLHAAKNYRAKMTAITISKQQFDYASKLVQQEGLSERIRVQLSDYRDVKGTFPANARFDKIVSIEMLEAVGDEFLEAYFARCHALLKKNGLLALQYIACPDSRHLTLKQNVDWIQKHIFPGSLLLSIHRVNSAIFQSGELFLHNLEDISDSYALTLNRWQETFNLKQEQVQALGFDKTFIRKWNYYLSYCCAAFSTRNIHVVQALYTFPNNTQLNRLIFP